MCARETDIVRVRDRKKERAREREGGRKTEGQALSQWSGK